MWNTLYLLSNEILGTELVFNTEKVFDTRYFTDGIFEQGLAIQEKQLITEVK